MSNETLTFPSDWPASCPPDDAEDAHSGIFRIVKNDPPEDSDFLTHYETGRLPKADSCLRCGLSTFRDIRDAIHQRQLMPRLGRFIANGVLESQHGKTKLTKGQQPTHTTWWVYANVNRAELFSVCDEDR